MPDNIFITLLQYPPEEDQLSQDEEAVLHFHSITVDILPQPVIDLDPVYPSDDLDPLWLTACSGGYHI